MQYLQRIKDYMLYMNLISCRWLDTQIQIMLDVSTSRKTASSCIFSDYRKIVDLVKRILQLYCDNRVTELYCKSDKNSTMSSHITSSFLSSTIEFGITLCLPIVLVLFLILQIHLLKDCHLNCSLSILIIWGWLVLMISWFNGSGYFGSCNRH